MNTKRFRVVRKEGRHGPMFIVVDHSPRKNNGDGVDAIVCGTKKGAEKSANFLNSAFGFDADSSGGSL